MTAYIVHYRGSTYRTHAASAAKAVSNVRYRENLRYAPMSDFTAEEVRADGQLQAR